MLPSLDVTCTPCLWVISASKLRRLLCLQPLPRKTMSIKLEIRAARRPCKGWILVLILHYGYITGSYFSLPKYIKKIVASEKSFILWIVLPFYALECNRLVFSQEYFSKKVASSSKTRGYFSLRSLHPNRNRPAKKQFPKSRLKCSKEGPGWAR